MNKVLFIRRDNIGDLICTTPAIHALREKFPAAKIGVLVNSYNADAVAGNPDVDEVYVYEKAKHAEGKNRFLVWLGNLKPWAGPGRGGGPSGPCPPPRNPPGSPSSFLTGAKN